MWYNSQNDLLVNMQRFSEIACLDGRAFGVISPCETCHIDLNWCVRRNLSRALATNQELVENIVGYNLTPRYHKEQVQLNGRQKVQLAWPGIVAINVAKDVTELEGTYEVSPFIIEDAPVAQPDGKDYCVVELDGKFVENPSRVVLRDETNKIYRTQVIDDFPKKLLGNWYVALDKPALPPCDGYIVDVQHCRFVVAIVPTLLCEGEVKAVRPGTTEVIPFAKEPTVDGANTIYWFHPWVLVDDDYMDDAINLVTGEFWKLIPEVSFICETSIEALPEIVFPDEDCFTLEVTPEDVEITILDAARGIVEINASSECRCRGSKTPLSAVIYYKTDPSMLNSEGSFFALEEAIAYLTAAELPLASCGCAVDKLGDNFITFAQTAYTDIRINPFSGQERIMLRYGNLHGQLVFAERIAKAKHHYRLITIPI